MGLLGQARGVLGEVVVVGLAALAVVVIVGVVLGELTLALDEARGVLDEARVVLG